MVLDLLRIQGRSGTAAMRARSRILLKKLENQQSSESPQARFAGLSVTRR